MASPWTRCSTPCSDHPRRLADAFGGVPQGGWERAAARRPETVGTGGRWRLTVYAYLVQTPAITLLIDAGVGPACSVAGEWLQTKGALPERLAAVGVAPESIDVVFFTHLHDLERADAERHVVGSAHLPRGWWRVGRDDTGRSWHPVRPAARRSVQDRKEGP